MESTRMGSALIFRTALDLEDSFDGSEIERVG